MEFLIPRMGRRADLIMLTHGIVFVIEYKPGARQFDRSSLDQAYGYGLDLKYFHETSHTDRQRRYRCHQNRVTYQSSVTKAPGSEHQKTQTHLQKQVPCVYLRHSTAMTYR